MLSDLTRKINSITTDFRKADRIETKNKRRALYGNTGGSRKAAKRRSKKTSKGIAEPGRSAGEGGAGGQTADNPQTINP